MPGWPVMAMPWLSLSYLKTTMAIAVAYLFACSVIPIFITLEIPIVFVSGTKLRLMAATDTKKVSDSYKSDTFLDLYQTTVAASVTPGLRNLGSGPVERYHGDVEDQVRASGDGHR